METVFAGCEDAPIVYLHMEADEAAELAAKVRDLGWTLAALSCRWNQDLTPWSSKAVFPKGEDFGAGAQDHLKELLETVIPRAEQDRHPSARYLVGYSLAGLFALWAATQTDVFDGVASVSGSTWYPKFTSYLQTSPVFTRYAYFSMGDKEGGGRNPVFHNLEADNRLALACFAEKGVETVFEKNVGGHFQDPIGRMERALRWLSQKQTERIL